LVLLAHNSGLTFKPHPLFVAFIRCASRQPFYFKEKKSVIGITKQLI